MNREELVNAVKSVVERRGVRERHAWVNGYLCEGVLTATIEDDLNRVEVKQSSDGSMEVTIFGECTSGGRFGNPVLCVDAGGEVYRYHGEFRNAWYLIESVIANN